MNSKIRFDFKSIRLRLWIYFVAITVAILLLVWVLQVFLLNNSYEQMKIGEIEKIGIQISHSYSRDDANLTSTIQSFSISNDIYVMMEYNGTLLLFTPDEESLLPAYRYRNETEPLKALLYRSPGSESVSYRFTTATEKYNTFAYCRTIVNQEGESALLYIFSPLYPVSSTVEILKNQLVIVTFAALCLAFIMAFFLSRSISKPLKRITSSAKKMGHGDYDVRFEPGSFSEINNLAHALNTATIELGRTDSLQRDLIANVSHDLKTPLTVVRSYAEMIRDLSGDIPEKRNKHLNIIIEETDRMAALVSDMSHVTQLQNAKIELDLSVFNLRAAVESIMQSYDILQEQDGYNFTFTSPKECYVNADESRIKQVIANLTGNAVKYCGDNKNIAVSVRKTGRYYRFEVTDHGPGIAESEITHIWDRYYRISENYTRAQSGSGLGLSIVKQILALHNADYGVESKLGAGSTFWFELEAVKRSQKSVEAE